MGGLDSQKVTLRGNRALHSVCSGELPLCRGCTSTIISYYNGDVRAAIRGVVTTIRGWCLGGNIRLYCCGWGGFGCEEVAV